jgi:hypothetical protein
MNVVSLQATRICYLAMPRRAIGGSEHSCTAVGQIRQHIGVETAATATIPRDDRRDNTSP